MSIPINVARIFAGPESGCPPGAEFSRLCMVYGAVLSEDAETVQAAKQHARFHPMTGEPRGNNMTTLWNEHFLPYLPKDGPKDPSPS